MANRWLWKILMIPACLMLVFGLVGTFYPQWYMAFYLKNTTGLSMAAFFNSTPDIALLLEVIFRANGLGMTMSGILAIAIILFAFREGEKWSIPALALAGGIGLIGEVILEMMIL
jgi:hypothetical protein